ncbi:MAG: hypothetical protein PHG47_06025 [Sulfuricella sp.]|nr:hypothetical protein [Sulfuricella sp.]
MIPFPRALLLGFLAVGLLGCVGPSPRYQTAYRYEPPTDAAAGACLEKCEHKLEDCQQRCKADYQACLKLIEPQVEGRYAEALKRYGTELDRYRWELDRYQLYMSMSWGWSPWYGHGYYRPWPEPYYYPPPAPPAKPSKDQEFSRLRQEKCDVDCGCQAIYDAGFLSCGGKKIPEVKCIANCPPAK